MSADGTNPGACPRCGSDKVRIARESAGGGTSAWLVRCENCQTAGSAAAQEEQAIMNWVQLREDDKSDGQDTSNQDAGGGGLHYDRE